MTYYLYRYREPTRTDIRTRIPWALPHGPYASLPSGLTAGMPLDPLATDSSVNLICTETTVPCTLVATVSGNDCRSGNTAACSFTDSDSLVPKNGFTPNAIYNYIMVVRDAEGNYQVPRVQRYRSPYFVGDYSETATASFRTEQRWRRASPMLVDENYQQGRTIPQIMVHVPMDVSGLDHDFFMHKYEASLYSGSATNSTTTGSANWPLQANASGAWLNNAGACAEVRRSTGGLGAPTGPCGGGANINPTSLIVQSKRGEPPTHTIDQGAYWKACANSWVTDSDNNTYSLSLPTDSEWLKAADWGDVGQDGLIDQSVLSGNIGLNIGTLENGTGSDGNCRASGGSATTSAAAGTAKCRSRYGAADMIGSVWEWSSGQIYNGVGYDNGVDGLWLGRSLPTATQQVSALGRYDLLRGFPASAGAAQISANGYNYWYASGLRGARRGGFWDDGASGGRWALNVNYAPSGTSTGVGGRCGL